MARVIWSEIYTLPQLAFRRLRVFVYRLTAVAAIVLALISAGVFVLQAMPQVDAGHWNVLFPPAAGAKAFWFTVLVAAYAWYRLERQRAWFPEFPHDARGDVRAHEHLSEEAWHVLEQAYRYAERLGHPQVDPAHLLAASLKFMTGPRVFARLGVDSAKLISVLRSVLSQLPQGYGSSRLSEASRALLIKAAELSLKRRNPHVQVTEIMVALAESDSKVKDVLEELAVPPDAVANITAWFALRRKLLSRRQRQMRRAGYRPKHALDRAYLAVSTPFLNRFSENLTAAAAGGYLAPCVGRENVIDEVYRLISGGQRGVVMVGPSGVGRGMVLHGIAQDMASDDVPEALQDKILLELSVAQLVGGANPAEAGERFLRAVSEAARSGNTVLALQDVHQLVGLVTGSGEGLTLADVLSNVVKQHGLTVIATTTPAEWRKTVEPSGLGQSLSRVELGELDDNSAIQVLESRVGALEQEHDVFFSYGALAAAVALSKKYLPDRYLPEKAMAVMEEVSVYVHDRAPKGATVTSEHVAQVVANKVHIPLTQVTQSESEKLLNLESILHQRIIGQDEAVKLVAEALRRARVNLRDQKRPVASFLFLGPTGVGKTELAKTVAGEYFGGEERMVRLDMSEYQTQESLYRLVGAPAGVGEERGLLTEAVHKNPYTLLLLDEIEKAHPDILNAFLQVLDDGRLTDATGQTVDFTSTIIIATSNAATQDVQDQLARQVPLDAIRKDLMKGGLKQYFRPEFLNRFDAIVLFKPLTQPEVVKVAELMLGKLSRELESKGVRLRATPEAVQELAVKGFDPLYGARPLRRVLQDNVDSALASYMLSGKISRRDLVVLEPGGVIRIEKAQRL